MPKSTKVSTKGRGWPSTGSNGSTNRLPGWGSAWTKLWTKDLLKVGAEQPLGHLGAVDAGCLDRFVVADLDGGDVLHGQHPAGGRLPVDAGDADAWIGGKVLGKMLGVVPLGHEIQFVARGPAELVVQQVEVHPAAHRPVAFQPAGRGADGAQVGLDEGVDAGPLDLDHDRIAVRQPGAVDLGQRGGRFRLGGEPAKDLIDRPAEFGLDHGLDVGQGLGRDLVLQPGQLGGDHGRQKVYPRAEELAQFDQHAAQVDGQRPVAVGYPLPALRGGTVHETPAQQPAEQDLPPDEPGKGPGKIADDAQVAAEVERHGRRWGFGHESSWLTADGLTATR